MTDGAAKLPLRWLGGTFAVCRLAPESAVPAWAEAAPFCSITRSDAELSLVVPEDALPDDGPAAMRTEGGWSALVVEGTLDFGLVGVLARLSGALADAGIALFVVSTYDTDYVLVKSSERAAAARALEPVAHFTGSR